MTRAWSLRPLIWRCGPQDEASDTLGDGLTPLCVAAGLAAPEPLDPTRQERAPEAGVADVLLVVGGLAGLARALAAGGEAGGVLARSLAELPLLLVVGRGDLDTTAAARVAGHLHTRGVLVVGVAAEAASSPVRAVLRALAAGETPAHAAAEAQVAGARPPWLSGAVEAALCAPRWAPQGWEGLAPDCANLLHKAWLFARARGSRYVGVEHVGEALLRRGASGQAAAALRSRLLSRGARLPRPWRELQVLPWAAPDWAGTPRLRALAAGAEQGLEPWLRGMLVEARNPVARAAGVPLDPGGPAQALELWAGPDDGLRLTPQPGDWLGRWVEGEPAPVALYADAPFTDPRLSPRAARWLGGGCVELPRVAELDRGDTRELVGPGEVLLRVGELLWLSRGTAVMGAGL